jgi:hypothetical protein
MKELRAHDAADELRTLTGAEMEAVSGGRADYDYDGYADWMPLDDDSARRLDSA